MASIVGKKQGGKTYYYLVESARVAGDRMVKLPASALDHRRFWDAMDAVSEEQLVEIERRIVARMVESFDVDCSGLVLDMTNFATYIDSANDRAPIAQRGHAKQKRTGSGAAQGDLFTETYEVGKS
jgi:transposase